MKTTTLALAAAMAAGTLTHAQEAVQWRVEDGGNGHWYQFAASPFGLWSFCRDGAEALGGTLAIVESSAEQAFLVGLATEQSIFGDFWLGGYQDPSAPDYSEPSGGWTWLNGQPLSFDQWGAVSNGTGSPPSPNDWPTAALNEEDYLEICFRKGIVVPFGGWDDQGEFPNPSLIEWSADCNGDGIVDYGQILDGTFADTNANGIPDTCECIADLTGNGEVNGADISVLLGFWGKVPEPLPSADINRDGLVDGLDLAVLLGSWGPCK